MVARARRIVDRNLHPIPADIATRGRSQRKGPYEDTAVAVRRDFEIGGQNKVFPLLFGNHHVCSAFVRVDAAVFHRTLARLAAPVPPPVPSLSVQAPDPSLLLFFLRPIV